MSCEVPPPSLCCPKFLQLGLNDRAVKVEFKKALTRKTVTFAMSHLIRKQESELHRTWHLRLSLQAGLVLKSL